MTKSRPKMRLTRWFQIAAVLGVLPYFGVFWFLRNPILPPVETAALPRADPGRLESDVRYLADLVPARNGQNLVGLNQAAAYIETAFARTGCTLEAQKFEVDKAE